MIVQLLGVVLISFYSLVGMASPIGVSIPFGDDERLEALAWDGQGRYLAAGFVCSNTRSLVKIWDMEAAVDHTTSLEPMIHWCSFDHCTLVQAIAFSRDNRYCAVALNLPDSGELQIRIYDNMQAFLAGKEQPRLCKVIRLPHVISVRLAFSSCEKQYLAAAAWRYQGGFVKFYRLNGSEEPVSKKDLFAYDTRIEGYSVTALEFLGDTSTVVYASYHHGSKKGEVAFFEPCFDPSNHCEVREYYLDNSKMRYYAGKFLAFAQAKNRHHLITISSDNKFYHYGNVGDYVRSQLDYYRSFFSTWHIALNGDRGCVEPIATIKRKDSMNSEDDYIRLGALACEGRYFAYHEKHGERLIRILSSWQQSLADAF